jgi:Rrf2 family protein
MLRLSKKADYALIAMKHLAMKSGSQRSSASPASAALPAVAASAREIAEQYDIPAELMAKVLQRLVRRGLLVSHQGTRGGYQLARPATMMSVADVIQAVDGPLTVTACSTDDHACEQFGKCSIRDPLWQIKERIVAALGTVTLAQMANDQVTGAEVPVAIRR